MGRPARSGFRFGLAERERSLQLERSFTMKWSKPEFSEMRFGFEVTMYIANR
jgi:pyrroloquinoline quinone biosynthesis protein A